MGKAEPTLFDAPDQATEAEADARAWADYRAGRVVSHEAVKAWLLSWGTDDETDPPQIPDLK